MIIDLVCMWMWMGCCNHHYYYYIYYSYVSLVILFVTIFTWAATITTRYHAYHTHYFLIRSRNKAWRRMRWKKYANPLLIYYHKATKWNTHKQVIHIQRMRKTSKNKKEHCWVNTREGTKRRLAHVFQRTLPHTRKSGTVTAFQLF